MKSRLTLVILLSLATLSSESFAQKRKKKVPLIKEWGAGPSVIYNYTVGELGFGGRAHLSFTKEFTVSPQFQYFPGFKEYKEMYLGVGAHYNTTYAYRWGLYGLMYAGWNRWFNYEGYVSPKAKPHNLALEPGIGVVRNRGCLRPFGEARYNWKWREGSVRIGVLLFWKACITGEVCPPVYL